MHARLGALALLDCAWKCSDPMVAQGPCGQLHGEHLCLHRRESCQVPVCLVVRRVGARLLDVV